MHGVADSTPSTLLSEISDGTRLNSSLISDNNVLGVRSTTFTNIPNIAETKAHYDLVSHFLVLRYSGSYFYGHTTPQCGSA